MGEFLMTQRAPKDQGILQDSQIGQCSKWSATNFDTEF